jgi:ectoine hydroxylase-related dioxygenase (phytanoyl-CoA dioxygenase family)
VTFESDGYAVIPAVLEPSQVEPLKVALHEAHSAAQRRGGRRNVLDLAEVRTVVRSAAIRSIAQQALGPGCFAVRGLLFDKTPTANWRVAWHQDLAIPTKARAEVDGFRPWTTKAGVPHCLAPAHVLASMVALRVHLDDCGPDDGPLRVLPGSHIGGKLDDAQIEEWKARVAPKECVVGAGGVVVMRPLLLHASSSATRGDVRRRVLHLEFAAEALPGGLQWADSV